MTMTILDDSISSDSTVHTARAIPGKGWEVSWLPGRYLDRNSAITAMVLTEAASRDDVRPGHALWVHVERWAGELGLDAPEALARTVGPPTWDSPAKTAERTDPEAGE